MNHAHLLNCPEFNKETEKEEQNLILNGPNEQKNKVLKKVEQNSERQK